MIDFGSNVFGCNMEDAGTGSWKKTLLEEFGIWLFLYFRAFLTMQHLTHCCFTLNRFKTLPSMKNREEFLKSHFKKVENKILTL